MVAFKQFSLALMGFLVPVVLAGSCMSSLRDLMATPPKANNAKWADCKSSEPAGGWACLQKELTFLIIECIMADLKYCTR